MTPVMVDTSVWRRHFMGGAGVAALGDLLDEDGGVVTHPWITAELVLGGLALREEILLSRLPVAQVVAHGEVLDFVRTRQLARRGIGWVDVNVLASALASSAVLWTLDRDLAAVAKTLRVDFDAGSPGR